jgi:hypothetical protein
MATGEDSPIDQAGGREHACDRRPLEAFDPMLDHFIATHLQKRLTDATHSR